MAKDTPLGLGQRSRVSLVQITSGEGISQALKWHHWAFGIAALETEEIRQLNTSPVFSEDSPAVGVMRVKEQQVPITTTTVLHQQ